MTDLEFYEFAAIAAMTALIANDPPGTAEEVALAADDYAFGMLSQRNETVAVMWAMDKANKGVRQ